MLTAVTDEGTRVEAERDLPDDAYRCPVCDTRVILKRGRVRVAHFAHRVVTQCLASVPESPEHLAGKRTLAAGLRAEGYVVTLEDTYVTAGRRVDVAVQFPTGGRVAIEVQDSAIAVGEVKRRNKVDSHLGFAATMWVFTRRRVSRWLDRLEANYWEARLAEGMRYLHNLHQNGVFFLDRGIVWRCEFEELVRPGDFYYERGTGDEHYSPERRLRATVQVNSVRPLGFRIGSLDTRFGRTATFLA